MTTKILSSFLVIYLISLYACNQANSVPGQSINLNDTTDFAITDWKLIGPFYTDSINFDTILNFDNLYIFGLNELTVNAKDLNYLTPKNKQQYFYLADTFEIAYHNLPGMIDLGSIADTRKPGNIYAACVLKSDRDQDIVFMTGSDENAKLILNGIVYNSKVKNTYRLVFQNYIFARLKKGDNLLLVKISNTQKVWLGANEKEPWRFIANYCSPRRFNSYYLKLEKMLIRNPVVPYQRNLRFDTHVHPIDPIVSVEILDSSNTVVYKSTLMDDISLNGFTFGLYTLNIKTNRETYSQDFYYGDIHNGFKYYIPKAWQIISQSHDEIARENLTALIDRYNVLTDYYKTSDFIEVSESKDGFNYKILDSLIIKTSRLVRLHHPNFVEISSMCITNCLLSQFEFFKIRNDSIIRIPFIQTSDTSELNSIKISKRTLIHNKWNPWHKNELYFTFPENIQPDYISIPTDFEDTISKELRIPTYFIFENREIERRYVFLYKELQNIVTNIECNREAFKNIPGTHFRAFISNVEDQKQYYIVQSPQSVLTDTTPKPLIVIIPWVFLDHIPFLRSHIVADIHIHEMYQWQADMHDFIIVHANARTFNQVVAEPIAVNNIFNTIEAVKQTYHVDTTRIHLLAYCGGTELATLLTTKYPHKFASLGIVGGFPMSPGNTWMKNYYSTNFTENLNNTPIFIIHGELDEHTPIKFMKDFVDTARLHGNSQIIFKVDPQLTFEAYPRLRHQEEIFNFFAHNQVTIPHKISYSTAQYGTNTAYWLKLFPAKSGLKASIVAKVNNNNINIEIKQASRFCILTKKAPIDTTADLEISVNGKIREFKPPLANEIQISTNEHLDNQTASKKNMYTEGPILNVFGNRFIIVMGTKGPKDQNTLCNKLANEFIKMWESNYYVKPLVKKDFEVTLNDFKESNLIIVGNQLTNSVFNNLYPKLPLKINKNNIVLSHKNFVGRNLGYYCVYPNPVNTKKYLLLLGGNDMQFMVLPKGNPAQDGYYDYEIYQNNPEDQYLVDHGYFNEYWELK